MFYAFVLLSTWNISEAVINIWLYILWLYIYIYISQLIIRTLLYYVLEHTFGTKMALNA
jgi:hypothetical protein